MAATDASMVVDVSRGTGIFKISDLSVWFDYVTTILLLCFFLMLQAANPRESLEPQDLDPYLVDLIRVGGLVEPTAPQSCSNLSTGGWCYMYVYTTSITYVWLWLFVFIHLRSSNSPIIPGVEPIAAQISESIHTSAF